MTNDEGTNASLSHWFDGSGETLRFDISVDARRHTEVLLNSRRTSDGLIEKIKQDGKYTGTTLKQRSDPCLGMFCKVCLPSLSLEPMSKSDLQLCSGFWYK